MADKIKDAEDRLLESLFASEPVVDDGFSRQVVRRINRRLWVRRLTIPIAAIAGAIVAVPPMIELAQNLQGLFGFLPLTQVQSVVDAIPQVQTLLMGAGLLFVGMISTQILQD